MEIGKNGLDLIKSFEMLRLDCYNDGYGYLTIGWGHLVKRNEKWKKGDRITAAQADALLSADLAVAERDVDKFALVPLSQNQYDALCSLSFNLGSITESKTLLIRLHARDYPGVAEAFGRYIYSAGQKSNGLIRRRAAEKQLFLKK